MDTARNELLQVSLVIHISYSTMAGMNIEFKAWDMVNVEIQLIFRLENCTVLTAVIWDSKLTPVGTVTIP